MPMCRSSSEQMPTILMEEVRTKDWGNMKEKQDLVDIHDLLVLISVVVPECQ